MPPVESNSTSSDASPEASSRMPVLSLTLINAREILRMKTPLEEWNLGA